MTDLVSIRRLPTGVPGLDAVLGGGVPEFSFNLIAGAPGAGKTTLAHQLMFALASPARPALFFTVLGEPPLKMLRYQQQFAFFDLAKVNSSLRFINLAKEALDGRLDQVLTRIVQEVEASAPALVFVDSFRSVIDAARQQSPGVDLQSFIQELGIRLTGWQATTFLIGEFQRSDGPDHPVLTIADGLIWLDQCVDRNSMVRKLQVVKMRGQAPIPGLHTFRIASGGLRVFPRLAYDPAVSPGEAMAGLAQSRPRVSTGVRGLDEMLGGGLPTGNSVLVSGPSGSGKTVLATQFIMEGVARGEPGVIAIFDQRPHEYTQAALAVQQALRTSQVSIFHPRSLDLSVDETLFELTAAIDRLGARRLVIDSLSAFELALAPMFRDDFRESLYRMVATLASVGVTMMMTAELEDRYADLRFSPHRTAFLTDAIILQRYVELDGQLLRALAVVKLRASAHSKDLRLYDVTSEGIVVGARAKSRQGLLTGSPQAISSASRGAKRSPRPPSRNR